MDYIKLTFWIYFIVALPHVATANSVQKTCTVWSEWTDCDSGCMRERHRVFCDTLYESEICIGCLPTTSTTSSPNCGEWVSWTACDNTCFKERHRNLCGDAVETAKCTGCNPAPDVVCSDYTPWDCDKSTCKKVRTRSCPTGFQQEKADCENCVIPTSTTTAATIVTSSTSSTTSASTSGNATAAIAKTTEKKESGAGGVDVLTASGIGILVLLAAGGAVAGGHTYLRRPETEQDEAELVYDPGAETVQDATIYIEEEEIIEPLEDSWQVSEMKEAEFH